MLMPKKVKFRRSMRGNNKGLAVRGSTISFGEYALKADDRCLITSRQIEAARKAIAHKTKRTGKVWIRVFPDKPITKKPNETRMGGGKSPASHYAAVVKPGKILFEIAGVTEEVAKAAFKRAADKLPVKTRFVSAE
ncbi:50S ribosomal protein L16 [Candidatus Nomurabacteria bacterium]|uniref:Large ribosomal subunit protein uL16 n=1 Tax=candidate division WWE3 bacterium TaxID=2053526 RepID=A0A955E0I1_UNCKA|nr:50S ribosomal protein L16 [candidate division WWE3 bacterium]MCB9823777.1 50S ribosomal protein L16 [Candidatus Nomurabacteria bacterium]MCB9826817.1 50S ribosomal protein L16 [Candidatus Nomurabacteria bacterium]MCB9827572.1 50S ribosomal protein L16 [Candidatus Nomurabacteria bacterium]